MTMMKAQTTRRQALVQSSSSSSPSNNSHCWALASLQQQQQQQQQQQTTHQRIGSASAARTGMPMTSLQHRQQRQQVGPQLSAARQLLAHLQQQVAQGQVPPCPPCLDRQQRQQMLARQQPPLQQGPLGLSPALVRLPMQAALLQAHREQQQQATRQSSALACLHLLQPPAARQPLALARAQVQALQQQEPAALLRPRLVASLSG
jgi:hypothetical protein